MKHLLHSIAKTWIGGLILHWVFSYFSFVIPGERLVETNSLLAFHHPSPSYPLHILIVPKSKLRSLADLPTEDQLFEVELFRVVDDLVQTFDLYSKGYRLIVNGGKTQEVDHLHFHLISEDL
ncbi:MAG: HIT domain-containing protein [Anaerolineales bacterium]